jgi:hypothetical protein
MIPDYFNPTELPMFPNLAFAPSSGEGYSSIQARINAFTHLFPDLILSIGISIVGSLLLNPVGPGVTGARDSFLPIFIGDPLTGIKPFQQKFNQI